MDAELRRRDQYMEETLRQRDMEWKKEFENAIKQMELKWKREMEERDAKLREELKNRDTTFYDETTKNAESLCKMLERRDQEMMAAL